MATKYLITIDQDDPDDIEVELDDPDYDGCETSINDPDGVYHVEAENEEAAIDTAKWLDSLGNPYPLDDYDSF